MTAVVLDTVYTMSLALVLSLAALEMSSQALGSGVLEDNGTRVSVVLLPHHLRHLIGCEPRVDSVVLDVLMHLEQRWRFCVS